MLTTIPITIDKSHLITIGEKLYQEGVELIRELVCNAYDADATNVWIESDPYQIKVRDDGSGMDLSGLRQYLTIGSEEKKYNHTSPVFKRERIGQFGIGKFAVLSACSVFKVHTQKGDFAAQISFDKELFSKVDNWDVPIHALDVDPMMGNGTIIILERLKKPLSEAQIERVIREKTPLKAPHFRVFLNGRQIEPYHIPGKRFQVSEDTDFGTVRGEIILPHFTQKIEIPGIEITVKGVMIRRETFGVEALHLATASRLIGSVAADFLPVTSDRSRFIIDSEPYLQFAEVMTKIMKKIFHDLRKQQQEKADQKADKVLKEAMRGMRKALRRNESLAPVTMVPSTDFVQSTLSGSIPDGDAAKLATSSSPEALLDEERKHRGLQEGQAAPNEPRIQKVKVQRASGRDLTARKIKVGDLDVMCTFESLGFDTPEYLVESNVIIINQSHKMYRRVEKKEDLLGEYILRLIAQELSRQYAPYDSAKAYELMNQLLRDAV